MTQEEYTELLDLIDGTLTALSTAMDQAAVLLQKLGEAMGKIDVELDEE